MKSQFNAALLAGWRLALWSLIGVVGWAAETGENRSTPAKSATNAQRFLFVIETSAANRKYEEGNRQAVFELIVGGVNSQMRKGDSLGIWTFNDEVRTGEFPVTEWEPDLALEIGTEVASFLKKQHYSKNPDFKPVVEQLRLLADRIGDFNVFIISTGREKITGTPYDQKINGIYAAYAKRPGKLARVPMVTSFVVIKGRPTRPSVVLAGEPIVLPERPPPIAQAMTKTNNVAVANSSNSPPVAATPHPAAIAGRTGETAISLGATTAVAAASAPRSKVFQFVTHTNPPGATKTAGIADTNTATIGTATNSHVRPTDRLVTVPLDTSAPALGVAALTAGPPTPAPVSATAAPPANPPSPELRPLQTPTPEPASKPEFSVVPISTILSAAAQAMTPPPLTVAAREPETARPSDPRPNPDPTPVPSDDSATAVPAAPMAMATASAPAPAQLSAGAFLTMGGTLLGATGFLLIVVLRRLPRPARGSLISQSMHRH